MNVALHRVAPTLGCQLAVAVLEYEARRARGVTLVVGHGYSSSKQNLDGLCAFLASHGFAVYSLDFPGHKLGASGGRLRSVERSVRRDGRGRALRARARRADGLRDGPQHGRDDGAVRRGPRSVDRRRDLDRDGLRASDRRSTRWRARGVVDLRSSYVDGLALQEIAHEWQPLVDDALARLAGRPVLFVAAERDGMVARSSVEELYARAGEPKTFVTVPSDHTFAGDNSRTAVLQWLNAMHPRRAAAEPRARRPQPRSSTRRSERS